MERKPHGWIGAHVNGDHIGTHCQ